MNECDWDAYFVWLRHVSPLRERELPMADHECRVCGGLECDCFNSDLRKRLAHGGPIASARVLAKRLAKGSHAN